MTSSSDGLPPSIRPGAGSGPRGPRRRPVTPARRARGGADPTRSRSEDAAPAEEAGDDARRAAAPRAGGGSAPSSSRTPEARRPSQGQRQNGARTSSHARPGSSAVPIGRTEAAPDRTRAMPSAMGGVVPRASAGRGQSRPAPRAVEPDRVGEDPARPGSRAQLPGTSGRPPRADGSARRRRKHPVLRTIALVLVILLALVGLRVAWVWHRVDSDITRTDALSSTDTSDGETWLIVGSDSRADGAVQDATEGARSDSLMILNRAPNGEASLISLPRDTYVDIPGYGGNKINAAYSYGGASLLVSTVNNLTGLTVDHYVQVGMGGVEEMVDAVGGINVCLDYDVNDADSGLVWDTSKGTCQDVDGEKALQYSRMRKSDPTGDIGRAQRQRAVISAVVAKAATVSTLVSFSRQDAIIDAGTGALTVDEGTTTGDLVQMMAAFHKASSNGLTGAPPISSLDYEPGGIGSAVLLQDTTAPDFFAKVKDGALTTSDFNQG